VINIHSIYSSMYNCLSYGHIIYLIHTHMYMYIFFFFIVQMVKDIRIKSETDMYVVVYQRFCNLI